MLGPNDQLVVQYFTETQVFNGPCTKVLGPCTYLSAEKRSAKMLNAGEYMVVRNTLTTEERIEEGPKLVFLKAYEENEQIREGTTLSQTEYALIRNKLTGEKFTVRGPTIWKPRSPEELFCEKKEAIALQADEYVRIKDVSNGERFVRKGKDLLFLEPTWEVEGKGSGVKKAWTLREFEYVRLQNKANGKITVHRGNKVVFPEADEELLDSDVKQALDLNVDEYVKIEDQTSGALRVVKGVDRVYLGANEKFVGAGKQKAVKVDEEHAVLVRDQSTGQLRLVTEPQLFVPGAHEDIERVQSLIRLADHEAVIVKDKDGNICVHYGSPDKQLPGRPRAFFLPPYAEIMPLLWSRGMRREVRDLKIERFDLRPGYMWFEFDCRTSDNVELVLETTMFFEVVDLEVMVKRTGNLPGDVYNQTRSQFIKHVAKVSLKTFMNDLHTISNEVYSADQEFYKFRGVHVMSLEVTRYNCRDERTSAVLQQIIEETTNRLNRLSQAESENEVNIFRVQGQIEHEKLNGSLKEIQQDYSQSDAKASGAAEAQRCAAFVKGLEDEVPNLEDRIAMWQVLRKTDALTVISNGGASLYYTPKDVDLSIQTTDAKHAPTTNL